MKTKKKYNFLIVSIIIAFSVLLSTLGLYFFNNNQIHTNNLNSEVVETNVNNEQNAEDFVGTNFNTQITEDEIESTGEDGSPAFYWPHIATLKVVVSEGGQAWAQAWADPPYNGWKYINPTGYSATYYDPNALVEQNKYGWFMGADNLPIQFYNIKHDNGYVLKSITVTDAQGANRSVSSTSQFNTYTSYTMLSITIYVNFEKVLTTYFFNDSGGSGGQGTKTVTRNTALGEFKTPTRAGYDFKGYYYNGSIITANTIIRDVFSVTVFAEWEAKTYTITFKKDGGDGGTNSLSVKYLDAIGTINPPQKTGYIFNGYKFSSYDIYKGRQYIWTSDIPATAQWIAKTTNITLDRNYGQGGSGSTIATYDKNLPNIQIPTRAGHTFKGYFYGSTQYYTASGTGIGVWKKTDSSITFKAKWEVKTVSISITKDSGVTSFNYDSTNSTRDYTYTVNALQVVTLSNVKIKDGYSWDKYLITSGTKGTDFDFVDEYGNIINGNLENQTLRIICYNSIGIKLLSCIQITLTSISDALGSYAEDTYGGTVNINSEKTSELNVNYKISTNSSESITLYAQNKTICEFEGFYLEYEEGLKGKLNHTYNSSENVYEATRTFSTSMTYYAVYKYVKYDLTAYACSSNNLDYNSTDSSVIGGTVKVGEGTSGNSSTYAYGNYTYANIYAVASSGYYFVGWYKTLTALNADKDNSKANNFGEDFLSKTETGYLYQMPDGDTIPTAGIKLYAKFAKMYSLQIIGNGESISQINLSTDLNIGEVVKTSTTNITAYFLYNSKIDSISLTFDTDHYNFIKWTSTVGSTVQNILTTSIINLTITKNIVINGYVEPKLYDLKVIELSADNITLNVIQNSSLLTCNAKVKYNTKEGTITATQKQGYKFIGWFKNYQGKNTVDLINDYRSSATNNYITSAYTTDIPDTMYGEGLTYYALYVKYYTFNLVLNKNVPLSNTANSWTRQDAGSDNLWTKQFYFNQSLDEINDEMFNFNSTPGYSFDRWLQITDEGFTEITGLNSNKISLEGCFMPAGNNKLAAMLAIENYVVEFKTAFVDFDFTSQKDVFSYEDTTYGNINVNNNQNLGFFRTSAEMGTKFSLKANANTGYAFIGWYYFAGSVDKLSIPPNGYIPYSELSIANNYENKWTNSSITSYGVRSTTGKNVYIALFSKTYSFKLAETAGVQYNEGTTGSSYEILNIKYKEQISWTTILNVGVEIQDWTVNANYSSYVTNLSLDNGETNSVYMLGDTIISPRTNSVSRELRIYSVLQNTNGTTYSLNSTPKTYQVNIGSNIVDKILEIDGFDFDWIYKDFTVNMDDNRLGGYNDKRLNMPIGDSFYAIYAKYERQKFTPTITTYSTSVEDNITKYASIEGGTASLNIGSQPTYWGSEFVITATAKTGYVLQGIYTNLSFTNRINYQEISTGEYISNQLMPQNNINYYAVFERKTFDITVNLFPDDPENIVVSVLNAKNNLITKAYFGQSVHFTIEILGEQYTEDYITRVYYTEDVNQSIVATNNKFTQPSGNVSISVTVAYNVQEIAFNANNGQFVNYYVEEDGFIYGQVTVAEDNYIYYTSSDRNSANSQIGMPIPTKAGYVFVGYILQGNSNVKFEYNNNSFTYLNWNPSWEEGILIAQYELDTIQAEIFYTQTSSVTYNGLYQQVLGVYITNKADDVLYYYYWYNDKDELINENSLLQSYLELRSVNQSGNYYCIVSANNIPATSVKLSSKNITIIQKDLIITLNNYTYVGTKEINLTNSMLSGLVYIENIIFHEFVNGKLTFTGGDNTIIYNNENKPNITIQIKAGDTTIQDNAEISSNYNITYKNYIIIKPLSGNVKISTAVYERTINNTTFEDILGVIPSQVENLSYSRFEQRYNVVENNITYNYISNTYINSATVTLTLTMPVYYEYYTITINNTTYNTTYNTSTKSIILNLNQSYVVSNEIFIKVYITKQCNVNLQYSITATELENNAYASISTFSLILENGQEFNNNLIGEFSRTGFVFDGWYYDSYFNTSLNNGDIFNKTGTTNLYAKWNLSNFTTLLTIKDNGEQKSSPYERVYNGNIIQLDVTKNINNPVITYSYQWYKNNIALRNLTNILDMQNNADSGIYHCVISARYNLETISSDSNVADIKITKANFDFNFADMETTYSNTQQMLVLKDASNNAVTTSFANVVKITYVYNGANRITQNSPIFFKDAGEYQVSVNVTSDGNYENYSATAKLTIKKFVITTTNCSLNSSLIKIFDKTITSEDAILNIGQNNETVILELEYSNADVGTSIPMTNFVLTNPNYEIDSAFSINGQITQKDVLVTFQETFSAVNFVNFNVNQDNFNNYVSGLLGNDFVVFTVKTSSNSVNTYPYKESNSGICCYIDGEILLNNDSNSPQNYKYIFINCEINLAEDNYTIIFSNQNTLKYTAENLNLNIVATNLRDGIKYTFDNSTSQFISDSNVILDTNIVLTKEAVNIAQVKNAGSYNITITLNGENKFLISNSNTVNFDFQVQKYQEKLSLNNTNFVYGEAFAINIDEYITGCDETFDLSITSDTTSTNVGRYNLTKENVNIGSTENDLSNYEFTVEGTYTISPKQVTISLKENAPAINKEYDGTSAVINPENYFEFNNDDIINSDTVIISGNYVNNSNVQVINANENSYKIVLKLTGEKSANYAIKNYSYYGKITPRQLTLSSTSVLNKDYDGTNLLDISTIVLANIIEGDENKISILSANYDNAEVSDNKPITIILALNSPADINYFDTITTNGKIANRIITLKFHYGDANNFVDNVAVVSSILSLNQIFGTSLSENEITLPAPTHTGYSFNGWFTENTFENQYLETTKLDNQVTTLNILKIESLKNNEYTLNLYAKWGIETYAVTINIYTEKTEEDIEEPYQLSDEGGNYNYKIDNNETINYLRNEDTLELNYYSNLLIQTIISNAGFVVDNISGTNSTSFSISMIKENKTVNIYFKRNTFTLTINKSIDENTTDLYWAENTSLTKKFGTTITLPTYTKFGHSFEGYTLTSSDEIVFSTSELTYTFNGDLTLVTKFSPKIFEVIIDTNGGTDETFEYYNLETKTIQVVFNDIISLSNLPNLTKKYYNFDNYELYIGESTLNHFIDKDSNYKFELDTTDTITLKANYTHIEYQITFADFENSFGTISVKAGLVNDDFSIIPSQNITNDSNTIMVFGDSKVLINFTANKGYEVDLTKFNTTNAIFELNALNNQYTITEIENNLSLNIQFIKLRYNFTINKINDIGFKSVMYSVNDSQYSVYITPVSITTGDIVKVQVELNYGYYLSKYSITESGDPMEFTNSTLGTRVITYDNTTEAFLITLTSATQSYKLNVGKVILSGSTYSLDTISGNTATINNGTVEVEEKYLNQVTYLATSEVVDNAIDNKDANKYKFVGWYEYFEDNEFYSLVYLSKSYTHTVERDITLYAIFEINSYTINFVTENLSKGLVQGEKTQSITYAGNLTSQVQAISNTGYEFNNWTYVKIYADGTSSESAVFNTNAIITTSDLNNIVCDYILTAHFEFIAININLSKQSIKIIDNNGNYVDDILDISDKAQVFANNNTSDITSISTFSNTNVSVYAEILKDGYKFSSWDIKKLNSLNEEVVAILGTDYKIISNALNNQMQTLVIQFISNETEYYINANFEREINIITLEILPVESSARSGGVINGRGPSLDIEAKTYEQDIDKIIANIKILKGYSLEDIDNYVNNITSAIKEHISIVSEILTLEDQELYCLNLTITITNFNKNEIITLNVLRNETTLNFLIFNTLTQSYEISFTGSIFYGSTILKIAEEDKEKLNPTPPLNQMFIGWRLNLETNKIIFDRKGFMKTNMWNINAETQDLYPLFETKKIQVVVNLNPETACLSDYYARVFNNVNSNSIPLVTMDNKYYYYIGADFTLSLPYFEQGYKFYDYTYYIVENGEIVVKNQNSETFTNPNNFVVSNEEYAYDYSLANNSSDYAQLEDNILYITINCKISANVEAKNYFENSLTSGGNITVTGITDGFVSYNETVNISVIEEDGYEFLYWEINGIINEEYNKSFSTQITEPTNYVAVFKGKEVKLQFEETEKGEGYSIISDNYNALNPNIIYDMETKIYTSYVGQSINIFATPNEGYTIDYWEFNNIKIDIPYTLLAQNSSNIVNKVKPHFKEKEVIINVQFNNGEGYVVNENNQIINNKVIIKYFDDLNLTVKAYDKYEFLYWSYNDVNYLTNKIALTNEDYNDLDIITIEVELQKTYWYKYIQEVNFNEDNMIRDLNGTGTYNNPYIISSQSDLALWAYIINENIIQKNPGKVLYNSSQTYYLVTFEINMNSKFWTPIGTADNPFNANAIINGLPSSMFMEIDKDDTKYPITLFSAELLEKYSNMFGSITENATITIGIQSFLGFYIILGIICAIILFIIIVIIILIVKRKKQIASYEGKNKLYK